MYDVEVKREAQRLLQRWVSRDTLIEQDPDEKEED